ncbi:hypothetical protein M0802_011173 [Mischocyttarus mexicanus]|nr:hypothetical protein M0802_011173 [Mischocyttarus mexicanus]
MSERKLEVVVDNVEKQYLDETIIFNNDIQYDDTIDVSNFDFSDNDRWLLEPVECSPETTVHDLYAWLRNSSETSSQNTSPATKRFTDTRTFTRPKKRNTRMSFESIMEALPPHLQNACKIRDKEFHNFYQSPNKTNDKKEGIPFMLKGTMEANRYNPDENLITSGQESMEAFLNMSQSKGIDSFINLGEPDFGDTLMNVSHPSVLYSSVISMNNDNMLYNIDYNSGINSDTFSHPTMDKCQFIKVKNPKVNLESTFVSKFNDKTIVKNKDKNKMSINNTYTSEPRNTEIMNIKDICNIDTDNDTLSTLINEGIETTNENALSSTYTNPSDLNITVSKSKSNDARNSLDITYQCVEVKEDQEEEEKKVPPEMTIKNKFDSYEENIHVGSNAEETATNSRTILPVQNNCINSIPQLPVSYSNHSSKQDNVLNSTFTSINKNINQYQSTCANPTSLPSEEIPSLRRELLTEIQRSGKYKLHSVYSNTTDESCTQLKTNENINVTYDSNIIQRSNIPVENKYNTYRKQPSKEQSNSKNELSDCNIVTTSTQKDNTQNRKFYTFTKKTANINGKSNMEIVEQSLPPPNSNIDETFCKPVSKAPKKKLHAPKKLSKLPQFLQNSNPNLLSNSIKTINATGYSYLPNVRQIKGTCVNRMEGIPTAMTTKSYSLGKLRSGSEQRLPHVDINTTFQKPNSGGSTESIDSTQSAHSAPDLDDRLSMCSDSSHNSYNVCTTNMEQLPPIVYMQKECTKHQSTPKPKKQILRNNWIDDLKDLPSPISKNHVEETESNSSSPLSIDSSVKTSSPIISPTESSQTINNNGENKISSNLEEKEQENAVSLVKQTTNKLTNTTETKTRLRQPSNWNTGNKPANVASGIPRPQSRIPALRFVRPNVKTTTTTQGDLKKGYL